MRLKQTVRTFAAVGLIALFSAGGSITFAEGGTAGAHKQGGAETSETKLFTLDPSTHGNPEGVAFDKRSGAFFVGAVGDGTIYRGTLGSPTVTEFIPGASGKSAIGMKVAKGKLYVAGGNTGTLSVYNIKTKQLVGSFETGAGGFLNDLVVTKKGEVFMTDSFRPTLWHLTAAQVAAGGGTPEAIPVGPEIPYEAGAFNLNGIVAIHGGRHLIVVQSNNGKLFRIDLTGGASSGREIHPIDVEPLIGGDGLLLDEGKLVVVQGGPPGMLTFVQLGHGALRGRVVERKTDPTFRGPSTVARAWDFYLVVNADFATSSTPFTVSGIPIEEDDDE
jgi:Cu-Zn family superoxide dismutase